MSRARIGTTFEAVGPHALNGFARRGRRAIDRRAIRLRLRSVDLKRHIAPVTGVTGKQGGAVARQAPGRRGKIRATIKNTESERRALAAAQGAQVLQATSIRRPRSSVRSTASGASSP